MRAWRPEVPGVVEVLHARMTSHVYPMHTHESWTLLIVDDGMVRYDLHRREHGALVGAVTLLPPHVPHNGRSATAAGFSKRVVYLDLSHVPESLIGQAVGQPVLADPLLRQRVRQLHDVLGRPGEEFEAEHRLAFIAERLCWHLRSHGEQETARPGAGVADGLRELIDARFREKMTLRDASGLLHAHPAHLVRAFVGKDVQRRALPGAVCRVGNGVPQVDGVGRPGEYEVDVLAGTAECHRGAADGLRGQRVEVEAGADSGAVGRRSCSRVLGYSLQTFSNFLQVFVVEAPADASSRCDKTCGRHRAAREPRQAGRLNGTVTAMLSGNQRAPPGCCGAPHTVCRYRIGGPNPARASLTGNP